MIKLGATPQTMRDYLIDDVQSHRTATGNPFAPGVSSQGAYSELDGWAEWTAEDWSSGIGYKNPDEGALNAIATTNFKQKIMLPLANKIFRGASFPDLVNYIYQQEQLSTINPESTYLPYDHTITVGTGAAIRALAIKHVANATATYKHFTLSTYGYLPYGVSLILNIYEGSAFASATLKHTQTITQVPTIPAVATWINFAFTDVVMTNTETYWFELIADNTSAPTAFFEQELALAVHTDSFYLNLTNTNRNNYNLSSWVPLFTTLKTTSADLAYIAPQLFNGHLITHAKVAAGDVTYRTDLDESADITSTSTTASPTCYATWGNTLFIAKGATTAVTIDTSWSSGTASFAAHLLHAYKGYLWRITEGNEISYSTDAATWTVVTTFYPATDRAIAMSGMNNCPYFTTREGIWRVAEGDFIEFVARWNAPFLSGMTGKHLTNVGEALYVMVDKQTIYQIDSAHQINNIMANNEHFLEEGYTPTALCGLKDYLCVAMTNNSPSNATTHIYLYRDASWHFLTEVPSQFPVQNMLWDPENQKLALQTISNAIHLVAIDNLTIDFSRMSAPYFAKNGWLEYDANRGGKPTLDKEWESIFADITLEPYTAIEIYGKYDGQTAPGWKRIYPPTGSNPTYTNNTWENVLEARITQSTAFGRRATKWAKIGVRFYTQHIRNTPILRALSLKYLPNVVDYDIFTLDIPIGDKQQMVDGTLNPYTADQQFEHLESLKAQETLIYYQNIRGDIYGCKVLARSYVPLEFDDSNYTDAGRAKMPFLYQMTLQQFEVYTPPSPPPP